MTPRLFFDIETRANPAALAHLPETLCAHGRPTRTHPDYEECCPDCDREDYADIVCDLRGGT